MAGGDASGGRNYLSLTSRIKRKSYKEWVVLIYGAADIKGTSEVEYVLGAPPHWPSVCGVTVVKIVDLIASGFTVWKTDCGYRKVCLPKSPRLILLFFLLLPSLITLWPCQPGFFSPTGTPFQQYAPIAVSMEIIYVFRAFHMYISCTCTPAVKLVLW